MSLSLQSDYLALSDVRLPSKLTWLVTGSAGFIGSHLVEGLLCLGHKVVGLDNFDTGNEINNRLVKEIVGDKAWTNYRFVKGDIRDFAICSELIKEADIVLHHAARGSVKRSIQDPFGTNSVNIDGFLNVLQACEKHEVKGLIYASSSSVYGDNRDLPKREKIIGEPLSPYAVSKRCNELYAGVYSRLHNLNVIGLRYFNVFGPRQSPDGPYAAVIPAWMNALTSGKECLLHGDPSISRDFCYVANVVQANLRAASYLWDKKGVNEIFNVGGGESTSLGQLYDCMIAAQAGDALQAFPPSPVIGPARDGDIAHSLADIGKIKELLNYSPSYTTQAGIRKMLN